MAKNITGLKNTKIEINPISNNLNRLMDLHDIDLATLEKLAGVPASTIYRLKGKKKWNPTLNSIKAIAKFFKITVSQLIGEQPIGAHIVSLLAQNEVKDFKSFLDRNQEKESITSDIAVSKQAFALRMFDSSMEPFLPENSILIIDAQKKYQNKDFVLLLQDHESPLVRQILLDGTSIYLKSLNPEFSTKPEKINTSKFEVIGPIVQYKAILSRNNA